VARTDLGSRILKVDHAGEFGAISIYTGQIWIAHLRARGLLPELIEFRSHERGHRAIFAAELERRGCGDVEATRRAELADFCLASQQVWRDVRQYLQQLSLSRVWFSAIWKNNCGP